MNLIEVHERRGTRLENKKDSNCKIPSNEISILFDLT